MTCIDLLCRKIQNLGIYRHTYVHICEKEGENGVLAMLPGE